MAQESRIHLPMQERLVQPLVQEDATGYEQLSPRPTTIEPVLLGPGAATTEPARPRARAPSKRSPHTEEPTHRNKEKFCTPHNYRNARAKQQGPVQPKQINKNYF